MTIVAVPNGPVETNAYVVADADGLAMVIDPGYEPDAVDRLVKARDLCVRAIVATHGHFDHVAGCRAAIELWAAPLFMHPLAVPVAVTCDQHARWFGLECEPCPEPDETLAQGDVLELGELAFEIRHTPGHCPGGICLIAPGAAIVGDTLFAGSIGRYDLPHSDFDALMTGIRDQLMSLPDETVVYPGHGPTTTIGAERRHNPFAAYFRGER